MHALFWAISLVALCMSAATDLKERIVPNEFVGVIAACGLAIGLMLRPGEIWISVLAAIAVLVGFGVLAHFDVIGGGDVKLISAVTLLVPPERIGVLVAAITLAGGVLGCVYLVVRRRMESPAAPQADCPRGDPHTSRFGRLLREERARILAGEPMPYALAVFGGVVSYIARELPQCFSAISCSV